MSAVDGCALQQHITRGGVGGGQRGIERDVAAVDADGSVDGQR